jgi:hypothetical protein
MSLMKKFPVDTIKIDRSFVQDLPHDAEDRAIAQAIISMGKALGLTVVAEGVETEEQAAFLREHGCDEMQGYLFSKPVPAERIPDILRAARLFHPASSIARAKRPFSARRSQSGEPGRGVRGLRSSRWPILSRRASKARPAASRPYLRDRRSLLSTAASGKSKRTKPSVSHKSPDAPFGKNRCSQPRS